MKNPLAKLEPLQCHVIEAEKLIDDFTKFTLEGIPAGGLYKSEDGNEVLSIKFEDIVYIMSKKNWRLRSYSRWVKYVNAQNYIT